MWTLLPSKERLEPSHSKICISGNTGWFFFHSRYVLVRPVCERLGARGWTGLPRGLNKDMKEIRHHVRERVFVLGTSSSGL